METQTVYCLLCIDEEGSEHTHIFSTPERRRAYAETDDRRHVFYDYLVDDPEAYEGRRQ